MDDLAPDADDHFGFGLTEHQVRRLQEILKRECGLEVTLEQAWSRAIELLALAKLLLEGLPRRPS